MRAAKKKGTITSLQRTKLQYIKSGNNKPTSSKKPKPTPAKRPSSSFPSNNSAWGQARSSTQNFVSSSSRNKPGVKNKPATNNKPGVKKKPGVQPGSNQPGGRPGFISSNSIWNKPKGGQKKPAPGPYKPGQAPSKAQVQKNWATSKFNPTSNKNLQKDKKASPISPSFQGKTKGGAKPITNPKARATISQGAGNPGRNRPKAQLTGNNRPGGNKPNVVNRPNNNRSVVRKPVVNRPNNNNKPGINKPGIKKPAVKSKPIPVPKNVPTKPSAQSSGGSRTTNIQLGTGKDPFSAVQIAQTWQGGKTRRTNMFDEGIKFNRTNYYQ